MSSCLLQLFLIWIPNIAVSTCKNVGEKLRRHFWTKSAHIAPPDTLTDSYTQFLPEAHGCRSQCTAVGIRETLSAATPNRVIRHPIAQSKTHLTELQIDNLIPTFTYMGTISKPLPQNQNLSTNHHAIVPASCVTKIKHLKQFRKGMQAATDQHTAREAWNDFIVNC